MHYAQVLNIALDAAISYSSHNDGTFNVRETLKLMFGCCAGVTDIDHV